MRLRAVRTTTVQRREGEATVNPDTAIDLPINEAMHLLTEHPESLRIDEPVKVIPGCEVHWMTGAGVFGPAIVHAVWPSNGKTWILVRHGDTYAVLAHDHVTEVNPSYFIQAVADCAVTAMQRHDTETLEATREFLRSLFDLPRGEDRES